MGMNSMKWVFLEASEGLQKYRLLWESLHAETERHLLLDFRFVGPLVKYFGSKDVLLAVCEEKGERAMMLLTKTKQGFWQTFDPAQAPLGLILLENKADSSGQMASLIRALPGYCLGLSVTRQDPHYPAFPKGIMRSGVEYMAYIKTARVTVSEEFPSYWRKRSKDLTDNLARRHRRLDEQKIQWKMIIDSREEDMKGCIQEYGRLEETGWKGKEGTAVTESNIQGSFYQEVLEGFCKNGEAVVFRLMFNGVTVASQLGIQRDGMLILLKMAYDETYRAYSPGFILQEEMFRAIFSNGLVKSIEFYGRVREGWTLKWTDEVREMYHLAFYRFGALPLLKSVAKRAGECIVRHD